MKIGYYGKQINCSNDGTTRLSRCLFEKLIQLDDVNDYILYTSQKGFNDDSGRIYLEKSFNSAHDIITYEKLIGTDPGFDLFFMPHPFHNARPIYDTSLLALAPVSILTVLDLINYKHPEYFSSDIDHRHFKASLDISCNWTDKIIAISDYTRKDFIETLGINPDKIVTIHLGVDPKFHKIEETKPIINFREKYGLKDKFMFFLGNHYPHKNITNLVKAFARLKNKNIIPHKLLLSGKKTALGDNYIINLSKELDVYDSIILTDHLDENDIVGLYNAADLMVFPSLHEGFGLPVIEAMACGTPVVCSNATSLPEIAGDAALLTDASNVDILADAIYKVCTDREIRNSLVEKGYIQSQKFTWEKTAKKTILLMEETYNKHKAKKFRIKSNQVLKNYVSGIQDLINNNEAELTCLRRDLAVIKLSVNNFMLRKISLKLKALFLKENSPIRNLFDYIPYIWANYVSKKQTKIDLYLIKKSKLFDPLFYLTHNPDILNSNIDPLKHFVIYGWKEGRNPSNDFDINSYLKNNPEAMLNGNNPLVHFILNKKY